MKKVVIVVLTCFVSLAMAADKEPIWNYLEQMPVEEKENVRIMLEFGEDVSKEVLQLSQQIEQLWNDFAFKEALALFPELSELIGIDEIAVSISSRTHIPSSQPSDRPVDIQVDNLEDVSVIDMDIDYETGHQFIVASGYDPESSQYTWTVNISTDGGNTWSRTFNFPEGSGYATNSVSSTVLGDYLYVAYTWMYDQNKVNVRRFNTADGSEEELGNESLFETVCTVTPPVFIKEVKIISYDEPVEYFDRAYELHCIVLSSDSEINGYQSDADAFDWDQTMSDITDAVEGLDACYVGGGIYYYPCLLSYRAWDNCVMIALFIIDDQIPIDAWHSYEFCSCSAGGPLPFTSISAYNSRVFCIYDTRENDVTICKIKSSSDYGLTWSGEGSLYDDPPTMAADVTLSSVNDFAFVMKSYEAPAVGRFIWFHTGDYPDARSLVYSDYEPYEDVKPDVEYIGNNTFGIVYVSNVSRTGGLYYDYCQTGYNYLPGDCNMELGLWPPSVIGGDVSYLVGYFIGAGNAPCKLNDFWASADVTGDCSVIGGDVSALVGFFIGTVPAILYCPDYEPAWLEGVPDDPPDGWPNCDIPVINRKVIPTGSVK